MKNIKINNKLILIFLFLTSFIALLAAYISQYFFNLQPCILCIYQRIPFFLVIFITLFALIKNQDNWQKNIIKISLFLLLINALLATYHVGVEQGIFIFDECSDLSSNLNNLNDLKDYLFQAKAIRCDEPQFTLFKISMAGWNIIYCLGIIFITIFAKKRIK